MEIRVALNAVEYKDARLCVLASCRSYVVYLVRKASRSPLCPDNDRLQLRVEFQRLPAEAESCIVSAKLVVGSWRRPIDQTTPNSALQLGLLPRSFFSRQHVCFRFTVLDRMFLHHNHTYIQVCIILVVASSIVLPKRCSLKYMYWMEAAR